MRLVSIATLRAFWERHPASERAMRHWAREVRAAAWRSFHDLKQGKPGSGNLGDRLACFGIQGNHYRIIAIVDYTYRAVFIRFVGTHGEYDQLMDDRHWRRRILP